MAHGQFKVWGLLDDRRDPKWEEVDVALGRY